MDWITHHAPIIGLLFFVCFFTLMVFWVFRPGAGQNYEHDANIPFEEDDGVATGGFDRSGHMDQSKN